jgi:hypothetical protein
MRSFFLLFTFASIQAFGALPPYYQSQAEIDALLSSEELQECLGTSKPITSIVASEDGWTIGNGEWMVHVKTRYVPSQTLGPAKFHVDVDCPRKISHE